MTRRRLLVLALVLVVTLVLVMRSGFSGAATERIWVTTERGTFVVDVETIGELDAVNARMVTRPRIRGSRGQIVELVPEGTEVEAGDFLIQFDTSDIDRQIEEREQSLQEARMELERQRADAEARRTELVASYQKQLYAHEHKKIALERMAYEAEVRRRMVELELKQSELSLIEAREQISADSTIALAEITRAERRVEQAESDLEESRHNRELHTMTAPVAGLVVYKNMWRPGGSPTKIRVGDAPWSGMDLIQLPDLSRMQVLTKVGEVDVDRVEAGQHVDIAVDALPGRAFTGAVSRVAKLASREPNTDVKTFEVTVLVDSTAVEGLRPGMSARCRIVTSSLDDVIHVPIDAVIDRDGTTVVLVDDGHERPVTLGPTNTTSVVVEEGLSAGERVALVTGSSSGAASEPGAKESRR